MRGLGRFAARGKSGREIVNRLPTKGAERHAARRVLTRCILSELGALAFAAALGSCSLFS